MLIHKIFLLFHHWELIGQQGGDSHTALPGGSPWIPGFVLRTTGVLVLTTCMSFTDNVAPPSPRHKPEIAGARAWNQKSRKAYGIAMSLYDQHPVNGKISGEPVTLVLLSESRHSCLQTQTVMPNSKPILLLSWLRCSLTYLITE